MEPLQARTSGAQPYPVSEHPTALHSKTVSQHPSNHYADMSPNYAYAPHNTKHAAAAQLPQLSHMSDSMLHAAAAVESCSQTSSSSTSQAFLALSAPLPAWQQQQQHKGLPSSGSAYDLEHVFPTGDVSSQQQYHSLQPPVQYAQYSLPQQQRQYMQRGASVPAMQPHAMQLIDTSTQQQPAAPSHSPFSGNPFSDPSPECSMREQQVAFPELRLPTVNTTAASGRAANLNPTPVQPEVASPPSTPDSFTSIDLKQYWMHTQQQQQQQQYMHPAHQFHQQDWARFPNMPGARVPSPLGIPANLYSTNSIKQQRGSNNLLPDFNGNVQQQQQQQRWSQPPSEYTTHRGTFEDAAAAASRPANVQEQLSLGSKEELLKVALRQAIGKQGEDVDQLVQHLLGALASAMCSTGFSSSSSSSRSGAASSPSGACAAGQAAPAYNAGATFSSTNPFADLHLTHINSGSSAAGAISSSFDPYFDSTRYQQYQQPAAAGLPSRARAGQVLGTAAAAVAAEQTATLRCSEASVPAGKHCPVPSTAVRGSDGGAGLMPVTPFANSSAGAQEVSHQNWQDRWQQGWHARDDPDVHDPAAMRMQDYNQQLLLLQQQQQCILSFDKHPTAQQAMLPPTAALDHRQEEQQHTLPPSQQHQIMPVPDMHLARQSNNGIAGQESSAFNTGSAHAVLATNLHPGNILAHPTAGSHAAALAAQMQAMMNVAAMAPNAMLVPAAVLEAPAGLQAAAAAVPQGLSSMSHNMAFGMYPAVPMVVPVAAAAATASMQYYQMMQQQQQQLYQAAAAEQTATAASMPPGQHNGISVQPSSTVASAGSVGAATAAGVGSEGATAGEDYNDGLGNNSNSSADLILQRCSSTDASILARRRSSSSAAAQMPALFPAAAWTMSAAEAAVSWLFGKGLGKYAAQGVPAQWSGPFNSTIAEQQAVLVPAGIGAPGLSTVGRASNLPKAVAVKARDAAAQCLGPVAHSGTAVARMYFMVCVWYAHYVLVVVLYSLLGMTSAAVASQQLVTGAGKFAAAGTVQLGLFAARQARLFINAAVRVISSDLEKLPQQLLLQPLVARSMLTVHHDPKQLLLTEAPSATGAAATALPEQGTAAIAEIEAVSRQASNISGTQAATLPSWFQAVLGVFMCSNSSSSASKLGTLSAAATTTSADNYDTSASAGQQQQLVSWQNGSITSVPLVKPQQTKLQQSYNLYVADSVSVISGLWVGLGIKLWLLVTIRVPFEASRIWVQAYVQGASLSAAAAAAATRYVLHAAWLLAQCSALILANTRLCLPQAGAAAVTLACRMAATALLLSYQVATFWWVQLGSHAVAAAHAMLKSTADSVPGGLGLLQLLNASAGFASYAMQRFAGGVAHAWQWLASADEQAWKSLTMHSVLTQLLSWGLAGTAWATGELFGLFEKASVAATSRILQGAPPMAQAAVWGSAGMLKRLVLEATHQSWMLLLGLYYAWQEQQRQEQQRQQQQ